MKNENNKPVALILAGYNKVDPILRKKSLKNIREAYDGEEIFIGKNKFLYDLADKPIIQYIIDAVYNAKKNGNPIYDKIYIYNDIESFSRVIDISRYPNLIVNQMTDSVGGHWRDFFFNYINYGQRVDIYFGDTPRVETGDIEWIHEEYGKVLGKVKDHRGVYINMLFSYVTPEDLDDNWMGNRIKPIKIGANKGKLKNFISYEKFQGRVGNSGSMIKEKGMDGLMEKEAINLIYNLRKALMPNVLSKIIYHIWKSKHFDMVKQVKNRNINYEDFVDTLIDVISGVYKIDLSNFAGSAFHISKNGSRWENDIDGPGDLEIFQEKFGKTKKQL